jgi:hypothetical protein
LLAGLDGGVALQRAVAITHFDLQRRMADAESMLQLM